MAQSQRLRSFLADTLALVIFFTVAGALNERYIAGMDWSEVAVARSIGALLMVVTARPYGIWRDWVFDKLAPRSGRGVFLTDCLSLLTFQVPIYLAIILAGGAEGYGILKGTLAFAVMMLVLGRPYGLFLEFVRRLFGLAGPGQKPMSLGG